MTTINPTTTNGVQTLASGTGGSALSQSSADFNMFLKMLTTQMQNQDPLSPMDTSQYTQQLVQYSQVEQTIQQTETLKSILGRLGTQDMAQASGFIGKQAQFNSAVSGLSASSPASWTYSFGRPAASVLATVTNAAGKVVDQRILDAGSASGNFTWDGKVNGVQAAPGAYTLSIQGADNQGTVLPATITSNGTINEVVSGDGTLNLGVNGVSFGADTLLRIASAAQ